MKRMSLLPVKKRICETWKDKELRNYLILKEIVIFMGLFEYLGLGGGLFFAGAQKYTESILFFSVLGISYYVSSQLGYRVSEMLVRLQVRDK